MSASITDATLDRWCAVAEWWALDGFDVLGTDPAQPSVAEKGPRCP